MSGLSARFSLGMSTAHSLSETANTLPFDTSPGSVSLSDGWRMGISSPVDTPISFFRPYAAQSRTCSSFSSELSVSRKVARLEMSTETFAGWAATAWVFRSEISRKARRVTQVRKTLRNNGHLVMRGGKRCMASPDNNNSCAAYFYRTI